MENEEKKLRKKLFNEIIDLIGLIVYVVLFIMLGVSYVFYNKAPDNFMLMVMIIMAISVHAKRENKKG